MQQSHSEDLLCSASTSLPNLKDDVNHDPNDLKEVVNNLTPGSTEGKKKEKKTIKKACQSIYPLHNVFVRKVKMLKKPK